MLLGGIVRLRFGVAVLRLCEPTRDVLIGRQWTDLGDDELVGHADGRQCHANDLSGLVFCVITLPRVVSVICRVLVRK